MNIANSRVSQGSTPSTTDTSAGAYLLAALLPLLVSVGAWCRAARQELPPAVQRPPLSGVWSALCGCLAAPSAATCAALSNALVRWCKRASVGPYDTDLAPLVGRAAWLAGELDATHGDASQGPRSDPSPKAPDDRPTRAESAERLASICRRVRAEALSTEHERLALELLAVEDGGDAVYRGWALAFMARTLHEMAGRSLDEVSEAASDNYLGEAAKRDPNALRLCARRAHALSLLLVDVTAAVLDTTEASR